MPEHALDRKVGRFTLEQVLYAVILLAALAVRLYLLEQKPQHHDESIHAFFSWKITQDGLGDYKYDPVYHGPVLYYSTAFFLWFIDSDFGSRLSCVTFGMGVLLFAWPMRRYLGRWGALSFLVLLSFSPSFVYFTRFLRHDIYVAFGCMMAIYYAFRYGETRSAPQLYLSSVGLAIAFCTKEDMYLLSPVFLAALALTLVWEILGARDRGAAFRAVRGEVAEFFRRAAIPLITSAAIFVAVWTTFYTSFFTHMENALGIDRALSYWWGQHSIKRIGGPWWYYVPQLIFYDPLIFFPLFAVVLGALQSRPLRDGFGRVCHYATYLLTAAFFIALYARPYEAPLLLLAAEGAAMLSIATRWVPDRFLRFSILWALGALATYGWAQEKVPWLLVPMVLPLSIVAGRYYGDLIESGAMREVRTWLPFGAVGALTLWIMVAVNFRYDAPIGDEPKDARHAEMLVYVQSTYDVIKAVNKIEEVGKTLGTGTKTRLAVSGNATWPFSWYLRHYPVNDLGGTVMAPTGPDIAQAIRSGRADCGIATRAVATAAGVGFVPLCMEHFDLLLRQRDFPPAPADTPEAHRRSALCRQGGGAWRARRVGGGVGALVALSASRRQLANCGARPSLASMRGRRLLIVALLALCCAVAPARAQLRGHGGPVRALAVSPDGQRLVSGSFDTTAITWSLASGTAEKVLRFHEGAVNAVAFLQDGRFATSGEDARIAIWQPGPDKPATVLQGHTAPVVGLAVSPDGKTLASASWDNTARLWPLAGGAPRVLEGHQQNVNGVAFTPDGRALVTVGYDLTLRIWPLRRRRAHDRHPADAAQCGRGRARTGRSSRPAQPARCISCRLQASCRARSRPPPCRSSRLPYRATASSSPPPAFAARSPIIDRGSRKLAAHAGRPGLPAWSVAFLPDNTTLLTGGTDRLIRRWNASTGEHMGEVAMSGPADPLAAYEGDPGAAGVPRLRCLPHAEGRAKGRAPDRRWPASSGAGSRRCRATTSRRR